MLRYLKHLPSALAFSGASCSISSDYYNYSHLAPMVAKNVGNRMSCVDQYDLGVTITTKKTGGSSVSADGNC